MATNNLWTCIAPNDCLFCDDGMKLKKEAVYENKDGTLPLPFGMFSFVSQFDTLMIVYILAGMQFYHRIFLPSSPQVVGGSLALLVLCFHLLFGRVLHKTTNHRDKGEVARRNRTVVDAGVVNKVCSDELIIFE